MVPSIRGQNTAPLPGHSQVPSNMWGLGVLNPFSKVLLRVSVVFLSNPSPPSNKNFSRKPPRPLPLARPGRAAGTSPGQGLRTQSKGREKKTWKTFRAESRKIISFLLLQEKTTKNL